MQKKEHKIWEGVAFYVCNVCAAAAFKQACGSLGGEELKVAFVDREFITGGF